MFEIFSIVFFAVVIVVLILIFFKLQALTRELQEGNDLTKLAELVIQMKKETGQQVEKTRQELLAEIKASRQETLSFMQSSFRNLGDLLAGSQKQTAEIQDKRLAELNRRMAANAMENEQKLDNMRKTIENRLTAIQVENAQKLDQMRETVDEKLQKTLEDRISQSFKLVSERLEQVYKGLGEMQTLASGVGDLKKVLSNVKTRGILGEIQLGAILEQILAQEQYDTNIVTKKGGTERVEYAVKLPGDEEGEFVYLPIDAKFPADAYSRLMDAYDGGKPEEIQIAALQLERAVKQAAKDIRDKYVEPPFTTDFAIMFLPFEGLYSEVVRRGLVETLQNDYKINIAGPTTMAALLNSLQMGFRTLAIQKHSSEVWNVLGAVKTEFDKFGNVLEATQQRISQANAELDKLVGVRTRQIQRKLKGVTSLPESASSRIIDGGIDGGHDGETLDENIIEGN